MAVHQTVQGRCPACGHQSLFLGEGGHVTCSRGACPAPYAADDLLESAGDNSVDLAERHASTQAVAQHFAYSHLPPHLQAVSVRCYNLAGAMLQQLPDSPELTAGLRKLLEAKDCFVRAAVEANR